MIVVIVVVNAAVVSVGLTSTSFACVDPSVINGTSVATRLALIVALEKSVGVVDASSI